MRDKKEEPQRDLQAAVVPHSPTGCKGQGYCGRAGGLPGHWSSPGEGDANYCCQMFEFVHTLVSAVW